MGTQPKKRRPSKPKSEASPPNPIQGIRAAVRPMTLSPRSLPGSLPLDLRSTADGLEAVPAVVLVPTRLEAQKEIPRVPMQKEVTVRIVEGIASTTSALAATTTDGGVALPPPDTGFLLQAEGMLKDGGSEDMGSRFKAQATDPTFDFNEYVMLRDTEDPYARGLTTGPGSSRPIPSDPRFQCFVRQAEYGISSFIEYASLPSYGSLPEYLIMERANALRNVLPAWWFDVCAVRAFNRLGRYSRQGILKITGLDPEAHHGQSVANWLGSTAYGAATAYFAGGDISATGPLRDLFTVAYWEGLLTGIFLEYFGKLDIPMADPSAPDGEYPFDPFPIAEVLFGLQVVHRQRWRLLDYARGELVRSIPLGPKQTEKVSTRITRRRKTATAMERGQTFETTSDSSDTSRDTSEVIQEASTKFNFHADASAGVDLFTVVTAKVSAGLSLDLASSSKDTKGKLNEVVKKTADRMKNENKVTVSTEAEETFEENRASELVNPNDEMAVTYLYHRLQQRYWISTEAAEVHSVVFVPELLPAWEEITEDWIRRHADILAGALLDPGMAAVLTAIRNEPSDLSCLPAPLFQQAAQAGIDAAAVYRTFTGGGDMPDMLASGQQCFERDYERRNTLAMAQARRIHQTQELISHIRRNILHYMRAVWGAEDYDQRMQRLGRMRVPVSWTFVPRSPLPAAPGAAAPTPLEVDGVFMPDSGSARPLTEVISPIGPIGYLFNCAIYPLRDDPRLVNLHQALAFLRAGYTRFAVTISFSAGAGVALRQATAVAPRSFSAEYTLTWRANRGKWLIPVPGRTEGDWIEVRAQPDGSLEALGLRLWLDGAPADGAILTVRLRATADLEDPHLRLVQLLHPLPAPADEATTFTEALLREMVAVLPHLFAGATAGFKWAEFTEARKAELRAWYHRFLMLKESGLLVTLDTANLVLDLENGNTPILEPFKRLHRYLDVRKAHEDLRRASLDNARREALLAKGSLGDPDVENVTLVGARKDLEDVIAVADNG